MTLPDNLVTAQGLQQALTGFAAARIERSVADLSKDTGTARALFADGSLWERGPAGTAVPGLVIPAANGTAWRRKFMGRIHAEWMGVRGDGATDSTAALQIAIDAAEMFGSEVVLPAGTILVGDGIRKTAEGSIYTQTLLVAKSGVIIRGQGMGNTTIKLKSGVLPIKNTHIFHPASDTAKLTDFALMDLTVDGNGANNLTPPANAERTNLRNAMVLRVARGEGITVQNVKVKNLAGHNAFAYAITGERCLFDSVHVVNGGRFVGTKNPHNTDWSAFYSTFARTTWRNCSVVNESDYSISNDAGDPHTAWAGGIEIHGDASHVVNCHFERCAPAVYGSTYIDDTPVSGQIISGNTMRKCTRGIVFTTGAPYSNPTVADNDIEIYQPVGRSVPTPIVGIQYDGGGAAYWHQGLGNAYPIVGGHISRNTIYSATPDTDASWGIAVHSLHDFAVEDNVVRDVGSHAMLIQGSVHGLRNVSIARNKMIAAHRTNHPGGRAAMLVIAIGKGTEPDVRYWIRGLHIENNHAENRVVETFDGFGNPLTRKSEGGSLFGIELALPTEAEMGGGHHITDVALEGNTVTNIRDLYARWHRGEGVLANYADALPSIQQARPSHDATKSPVDRPVQLGETFRLPDGRTLIVQVPGTITPRVTPDKGLTAQTSAGSPQITLGGAGVAQRVYLRPGMRVELAGAGPGGGTLYTSIVRFYNELAVELADPAGATSSGANLSVMPALVLELPAPTAPAPQPV